MVVYVVQDGDTIDSIAEKFQVSLTRLIRENELQYLEELVVGQTIVITFPQEIYLVKEGDTLTKIAEQFEIPLMELYRNNAFLWRADYIYPGEELVIRYDRTREISCSGYVFPYIQEDVLLRTLPYLTYLSILNYKTIEGGQIECHYDERKLIETAKEYGVQPLMLLSDVSIQGERKPEIFYDILLNPQFQENHANNMLHILKEKGYYGINITISYLSETNQYLYYQYFERITRILNQEGFPVFITIDPNIKQDGEQTKFPKMDFSGYNKLVEEIYIRRFYWGTFYGPPAPVSSMEHLNHYLDFVKQTSDVNMLNIGFPLLGYLWSLPYIPGCSQARSITLNTVMDLARQNQSVVQFDEVSKTPFINYVPLISEHHTKQEIWFVDARTIQEIINIIEENGLEGTGLWNIMCDYCQVWLMINSMYRIRKTLPEF